MIDLTSPKLILMELTSQFSLKIEIWKTFYIWTFNTRNIKNTVLNSVLENKIQVYIVYIVHALT